VLWTREHAPTPCFSIVFILNSHLSLSRSLGAHHLHWKKTLMEILITFYFFCFRALDPLWTSSFLAFRIFPPNQNFTSFLHYENFLMESLIVLCLFNFPTLHFLQSSNSLVFWNLPLNPNFISLLHWENFLMESLIAVYFISRKKLRRTLQPKVVDFLNLPIARMGHKTYI
jgi:hypothetical protein